VNKCLKEVEYFSSIKLKLPERDGIFIIKGGLKEEEYFSSMNVRKGWSISYHMDVKQWWIFVIKRCLKGVEYV
jgi:hypothetical protein